MNNNYNDITKKLGTPKWYDKNGVPRYCKYHPTRVHNIYADYSVLMVIKCQNCDKKIKVAISYSKIELSINWMQRDLNEDILKIKKLTAKTIDPKKHIRELNDDYWADKKGWADKLYPTKTDPKIFKYGDPPRHAYSNKKHKDDDCMGCSSTTEAVEILEFWERKRKSPLKPMEWYRIKKHEIKFKSLKESFNLH